MKPLIKNIVIGIVIVMVLLGGYYYFVSSTPKQIPDLTSSNSISNLSDKINNDTAFLTTLIGLTGLEIDTSFFGNQSFSSLVDNSVLIDSSQEGAPGRTNPFAPIYVPVVSIPVVDINPQNTNSSLNANILSNVAPSTVAPNTNLPANPQATQ